MRMRTFIAATLAVALVGYLGFRILDLEDRVAALTTQIGALPEPAPVARDPSATPSAVPPPQGFQQRITAAEGRLSSIEARLQQLEKSGVKSARAVDDKDILSVVERENNRIKDVQLEWSRARWLENRDSQLATFSKQYGLTQEQTAGLQKAFQDEVDGMAELLRRPDVLDDPDGTATELQTKLDATDAVAKKLLNPAQLGAWNQGRGFERRLLWPWLPSNLNK
jgi:hypothetical protein